jgi:hypothetical protein
MENSYRDTIKNLFLFLEKFLFQIRKQSKQIDFKCSFYYNLPSIDINSMKNNYEEETFQSRKRKKEITNTSKDCSDFPFSYLKCISSTFHSAVINQPQFNQSLLLIQTFFGMIEPIFIISCLLNKNEQHLKEILFYILNQNTYEFKENLRINKNEIPLLLEAFFIRFFIFFVLLNSELIYRGVSNNNENLKLDCKNKTIFQLINILKTKNRILEKINKLGIFIDFGANPDNHLKIEFIIKQKNGTNDSSTSYTVSEKYFIKCQDFNNNIPDILAYIEPNVSGIEPVYVNKESDKLSKNYNLGDRINNIDCLRILQQLDNSIFGAISLQSLTMVDFNYKMCDQVFSEKLIAINIINEL